MRPWVVFIALLGAGGAVACASDTLLGELSLLSDGRFAWNKARVAGGALHLFPRCLIPSLACPQQLQLSSSRCQVGTESA